jgi:Zn-dependent peptidase ImmA (M78 family)
VPTTLHVSAELLRWARETSGLSVQSAAKKAGIRPDRLATWEESAGTPTPRQLERLADAVKRPVATFFLPKPPQEPALPIDFRTLPDSGGASLSPATLLAIRRARRLQGTFTELAADLGESIRTTVPRITRGDPDQVAERFRRLLEADATDNEAVATALNSWRHRVEATGVLVFQFGMPVKEVRGFSLSNGVPAIVLNNKDAQVARTFTLLHEFTHLALGSPGLCNPDELQVQQNDGTEVFCNAVAGACLVPVRSLERDPRVAGLKNRTTTAGEVVQSIANSFGVSRYVALRRLLTLGIVSQELYRRTVDDWEQGHLHRPRPSQRSAGR